MGRNGESGAFGLAAARSGVAAAGVGARFARLGTGIGIGAGTSNVASEPLRDRTDGEVMVTLFTNHERLESDTAE